MGPPLGPSFADILTSKLEYNQLRSPTRRCTVYKGYFDILCVVEKYAGIKHLLHTFHSVHPNLRFTPENGTDHTSAYLDVHVGRRRSGK